MERMERIAVYCLGGALLAAVLWRMVPGDRAPIDAAGDVLAGTLGVPSVVPAMPADYFVGMSNGPDDGDPGPVWYTAAYPGSKPLMPAQPPAAKDCC